MADKDYLKEHLLEILKDYDCAKTFFHNITVEKAKEIFKSGYLRDADMIRDEPEYIDFNFGCLCLTLTKNNGMTELGQYAEVYDDNGSLIASSLDCESNEILKEKLTENVIFIQNVFNEQGCKVDKAEMQKITDYCLKLIEKM